MRSATHTPHLDSHPWWRALLMVGLMLLGGFVGLIAAAAVLGSGDEGFGAALVSVLTGTRPSGDFVAILAGSAFVAAGFLIGGWLGLALLRLGRRGIACPRCGTLNGSAAGACEACDLPFR